MNSIRTIARLEAFNRSGESCKVIIQKGNGGYRVFIDGGILADGECDATYKTLAGAMLRMASEAEAAIDSQSMFA